MWTALTIDADVLRAARARAERTGVRVDEVIEDAMRKHLGLDLVARLWERADLDEDEAVALAVEAQHETRR